MNLNTIFNLVSLKFCLNNYLKNNNCKGRFWLFGTFQWKMAWKNGTQSNNKNNNNNGGRYYSRLPLATRRNFLKLLAYVNSTWHLAKFRLYARPISSASPYNKIFQDSILNKVYVSSVRIGDINYLKCTNKITSLYNEDKDTEHLWDFFKSTLHQVIEENIPSRTARWQNTPPWLNQHLKSMLRSKTPLLLPSLENQDLDKLHTGSFRGSVNASLEEQNGRH